MIFGIFGTEFSEFFASYHFVTHPKNSVSLQSVTSETNLFFAISLRSFSLSFRFVSLSSEIWGHPTLGGQGWLGDNIGGGILQSLQGAWRSYQG